MSRSGPSTATSRWWTLGDGERRRSVLATLAPWPELLVALGIDGDPEAVPCPDPAGSAASATPAGGLVIVLDRCGTADRRALDAAAVGTTADGGTAGGKRRPVELWLVRGAGPGLDVEAALAPFELAGYVPDRVQRRLLGPFEAVRVDLVAGSDADPVRLADAVDELAFQRMAIEGPALATHPRLAVAPGTASWGAGVAVATVLDPRWADQQPLLRHASPEVLVLPAGHPPEDPAAGAAAAFGAVVLHVNDDLPPLDREVFLTHHLDAHGPDAHGPDIHERTRPITAATTRADAARGVPLTAGPGAADTLREHPEARAVVRLVGTLHPPDEDDPWAVRRYALAVRRAAIDAWSPARAWGEHARRTGAWVPAPPTTQVHDVDAATDPVALLDGLVAGSGAPTGSGARIGSGAATDLLIVRDARLAAGPHHLEDLRRSRELTGANLVLHPSIAAWTGAAPITALDTPGWDPHPAAGLVAVTDLRTVAATVRDRLVHDLGRQDLGRPGLDGADAVGRLLETLAPVVVDLGGLVVQTVPDDPPPG